MTPAAGDALAVAAQRGDRQAFEALIRREKSGVYAFARRYVGDADEAYDIVQETFVSAWRSLDRYDPARSFPTWLRAIALNKCRDHARRVTVRRLVERALAAEASSTAAPQGSDDAEADLARLDRAIAQLPVRYKEPLLLTTAGGLSHEEAARVLRLTSKAVEMRLYRARRRLAEIMGGAGEG